MEEEAERGCDAGKQIHNHEQKGLELRDGLDLQIHEILRSLKIGSFFLHSSFHNMTSVRVQIRDPSFNDKVFLFPRRYFSLNLLHRRLLQ